jgi:hypothetical protein
MPFRNVPPGQFDLETLKLMQSAFDTSAISTKSATTIRDVRSWLQQSYNWRPKENGNGWQTARPPP